MLQKTTSPVGLFNRKESPPQPNFASRQRKSLEILHRITELVAPHRNKPLEELTTAMHVTRKGFNPNGSSAGEIEQIKLEDDVRLHEIVKVDLGMYARETGNLYHTRTMKKQ